MQNKLVWDFFMLNEVLWHILQIKCGRFHFAGNRRSGQSKGLTEQCDNRWRILGRRGPMCWFMLWHLEQLCCLLGITSLYQWNWGGKSLGIHSGSSLDFMTPGCILHHSIFLLPEKVWKNHVAMFPARSEPDIRLLVGFYPTSSKT